MSPRTGDSSVDLVDRMDNPRIDAHRFGDFFSNRFGHGGNPAELTAGPCCRQDGTIDFGASLNPPGPPEYLRRVIYRNLAGMGSCPDPRGER
jgi:hypothetical protein